MNTPIISALLAEMEYSKRKQKWPDHPAAQAGMVIEKAGQLMAVCMDKKYQLRGGSDYSQEQHRDRMWEAALQTAAEALRFLEQLQNSVKSEKGPKSSHTQHAGDDSCDTVLDFSLT